MPVSFRGPRLWTRSRLPPQSKPPGYTVTGIPGLRAGHRLKGQEEDWEREGGGGTGRGGNTVVVYIIWDLERELLCARTRGTLQLSRDVKIKAQLLFVVIFFFFFFSKRTRISNNNIKRTNTMPERGRKVKNKHLNN